MNGRQWQRTMAPWHEPASRIPGQPNMASCVRNHLGQQFEAWEDPTSCQNSQKKKTSRTTFSETAVSYICPYPRTSECSTRGCFLSASAIFILSCPIFWAELKYSSSSAENRRWSWKFLLCSSIILSFVITYAPLTCHNKNGYIGLQVHYSFEATEESNCKLQKFKECLYQ